MKHPFGWPPVAGHPAGGWMLIGLAVGAAVLFTGGWIVLWLARWPGLPWRWVRWDPHAAEPPQWVEALYFTGPYAVAIGCGMASWRWQWTTTAAGTDSLAAGATILLILLAGRDFVGELG